MTKCKGPFIATQLISTRRWVEFSWVELRRYRHFADATQLNSTSSWVELCRYKRALKYSTQHLLLVVLLLLLLLLLVVVVVVVVVVVNLAFPQLYCLKFSFKLANISTSYEENKRLLFLFTVICIIQKTLVHSLYTYSWTQLSADKQRFISNKSRKTYIFDTCRCLDPNSDCYSCCGTPDLAHHIYIY